ncbi:MAG: HIT family protein, partial [Pseudobdellovibrionaceae bacterium]
MSLFTKIIAGELPCYKIHEDELTFSFLALDQINLGHTLVVPKLEVDHFMEVPPDTATRLFLNSQMIGKAIRKVTECKRVGIIVQGFEVPHTHIHLIPAWGPG